MTSFERSVSSFKAQFGKAPEWVSHAPGRVNLIGEHVDYNDGFVLPAAIDRRLCIASAPAYSNEIQIYSEQEDELLCFSLDHPHARSGRWTDYVLGVFEAARGQSKSPVGLLLSICSDVPSGAGLSSSAALEMAVATLIEEAWGVVMNPVQKALMCQAVESDFVGMPCGIMDQFIVGLGRKDHLLKIDCQNFSHKLIRVDEEFPQILIINSNVKHSLTDGGYASRRAQCDSALAKLKAKSWRSVTMQMLDQSKVELDEIEFRRGKHVVTEIQRTQMASDCVKNGDIPLLASLLYDSHASLRHDFEVSCPELDWIVDRMKAMGEDHGIYGCRMTGGGFGGCAVSLVKPESVNNVIQALALDYEKTFGISADFLTTKPADGCQLVAL